MSQEVVQVVGTGDDGIWVEGVQQSACGACSARAGCGQHTLSKMGKPVRFSRNGDARPGVLKLPCILNPM